MDWTINCFKHKEGMWKRMAEASAKGGPRAYAWKQSEMWGEWAGTAAATFESLKGTSE